MIETRRVEQYLALIALAILVIGSLLVIRPFFSAVLLALILTISSWPLYESLLRVFKGRKTLAAAVVSLGLAAALILPLAALISSVGREAADFAAVTRASFADGARPPAPPWLAEVPLVGEKLTARWETFSLNASEMMKKIQPYLSKVFDWVVSIAATLGGAVLEICVALIISFFFFRDGLVLAGKLRAVMVKLAGTRAEGLIRTAGFTLKGVVYGILGTALVQGILAAIGFLLAGVPAAALLGLVTSFFSLVPVGPPLIWIPASIWLFSEGESAWGIFMVLWGAVVISGADNVVKPYLISRGSNLPIALIFIGVIGGAVQFGFLGVFLGPTLLALLYSLVKEWLSQPAALKSAAAAES